MAITHDASGTMFTGEDTHVFQLISVKHALSLEKLGMRHSKLGSIRKSWAIKLGMKSNATCDEIIKKIDQLLEEKKAAMAQQ